MNIETQNTAEDLALRFCVKLRCLKSLSCGYGNPKRLAEMIARARNEVQVRAVAAGISPQDLQAAIEERMKADSEAAHIAANRDR